MTREDTSKLLTLITQTYPNFKLTDPKMAVAMWQKILENDDPLAIQNALIDYARTDTSGFAPTPGKLHMMVVGESTSDSDSTLNEIVAEFEQAARNGIYGSQTEFNRFSAIARKAIGSPNTIHRWATMDDKSRQIDITRTAQVYIQLTEKAKQDVAVRRISEGKYKELMSPQEQEVPMIEAAKQPVEVREASEDEIERTVYIDDTGVRKTTPPKEKWEALMERLKNAESRNKELT